MTSDDRLHGLLTLDQRRGSSPLAKARRRMARLLREAGLRPSASEAGAVVCKEYSVPLVRDVFPTRAVLRLSLPHPTSFPWRRAGFAEHRIDAASGEASSTVVALDRDRAIESNDLGGTWRAYPLPVRFPAEACFTTSSGARLIATAAQVAGDATSARALVYRFDPHWRSDGEPLEVAWPWHGVAGIGEANGTVMFAEYPNNRGKYDFYDRERLSPSERLVCPARVFRSRDDGRSWEVVWTASAEQIRHFHTLIADPVQAGRWWLTSGDQAHEVFVWRSDDDGDSWVDVTATALSTPLHASCEPRASQRMTDAVFHDGWMIWGADDWLGDASRFAQGDVPAVGSRVYRAWLGGDGPLEPQEVGYCGLPIRSVVDVGPAFLFVSEAKHGGVSVRPETYLVFKDELDRVHRFVQIDNYESRGTGFTYSRASRAAKDGVFFSFRSVRDAFAVPPRLLRWELKFF